MITRQHCCAWISYLQTACRKLDSYVYLTTWNHHEQTNKIHCPSPQWNGDLLLSTIISYKYSILHRCVSSCVVWLIFQLYSLQQSCVQAEWMDHFERYQTKYMKNYMQRIEPWHFNVNLDVKVLMVVFAVNIFSGSFPFY